MERCRRNERDRRRQRWQCLESSGKRLSHPPPHPLRSGLFNCPHGITTDSWGNVWVTDTGLHQVLKFSADGTLLLSVGKRLKPGHDSEHLCAPTAVAVSADGSFFVADGYCNNRVVAFTRDGAFAGEWSPPADSPAGGATMQVVHSLALDECAGLLYVADRERGRVFVLENIKCGLELRCAAAGCCCDCS